jgi:hypothetical protein
MVDTVRSLSALQTLLADNTAGDISAQDHRDQLISEYSLLPDAPAALDAEDYYWDGTQVADFTEITTSGSQTITEVVGKVSALFSGQSTQDANGLLQARTFSIGDSFAVPIRLMTLDANARWVGVCFTDGVIGTSNLVMAAYQLHLTGPNLRMGIRHGTITAVNAATLTTVGFLGSTLPWLWVRLTYQADNEWAFDASPDGITWSPFGVADVSKTMTPTHWGLVWSSEAAAGDSIVTFGPLLKLA